MTQNIEYGTPGYLLSVVSYLKIIVSSVVNEKETALYVYKCYDKYVCELWRG